MKDLDEIYKTEWHLCGIWDERPLTVSYWILNRKSKDKSYQIYAPLISELIYLKGGYEYMPKPQLIRINKAVRKLIKSKFNFFNKLFTDIQDLTKNYKKFNASKKNLKLLLEFLEKTRELNLFWHVLMQLNHGITAYLEQKSKEFGNVNYMDYIKLKKEKTIKKDKFFQENHKILMVASKVSKYRLKVAKIFFEVYSSFEDAIKTLARKYSTTYDDLTYYTYLELTDLIKKGKKLDRKIIGFRKFNPNLIRIKDEMVFVPNHEVEKLKQKQYGQADFMKGNPAFHGYAKGFAIIVMGLEDFIKIKEGRILISPETTPDYVPLLKKVSAIVTEFGGITSHAAIVSREMKKPCIVGIKNVTKILKDGDYIEVDADKGIVRKIR